MLSRFIGGVALAALAVVASSQVYTDSSHKILVPSSTLKQKGLLRSHYLVNLAPDPTNHVVLPGQPKPKLSPNFNGYYPADIRAAYRMPSAGGSGAVAIVDAFNNPTALTDFNLYASTFGLPVETSTNPTASTNTVFQVVYANGLPANDSGWSGEIALDIEAVHAVAPHAKVYLVEAKNNSFTELWKAIHVAKALPGVHEVSMSFGGDEFSTENTLDSEFSQPGVTFFASSGDVGGVAEYPSESPNVVGVGGTNLQVNSNGLVTSETAWGVADPTSKAHGSGGGISLYEPIPSFQSTIASLVGTKRGTPDVSAVADPATGLLVYSAYAFGGWQVIGGTSLACPVNAAIANARGSWSTSSAAENTRNYFYLGTRVFRDIISGHAGTYSAAVGWDKITGCGSPVGPLPGLYTYLPTAVSVGYGKYFSGTLANIQTLDGNGYITVSAPSPSASASYGEKAGVLVTVKWGAAASLYAKNYIYFNTSCLTTTSVDVYCYDYSLSKYGYIGSYSNDTTTSNRYWLMNPATANHYQDSTNAFHLWLQPHTAGNNTNAFTFKIDRVVGFGYY